MQIGYAFEKHPIIGLQSVVLWIKEAGTCIAQAKIVPGYGANLYALAFDGIELLFQGPTPCADDIFFGTPVLYPFPNRIRGCKAHFEGKVFALPDNDNGRSLHNFVAMQPFEFAEPMICKDSVSLKTWITINAESSLFKKLPVCNRLEITFTLMRNQINIAFTVSNTDSLNRLPFGFALHPYFNVLGKKEQVRIHVPAKKWMEAERCLPSGRLLEPQASPGDLTIQRALSGLDLDDVWWGMSPEKPASLEYDLLKRRLVLESSAVFTHCVTYIPPIEGFVCIENQTCSTDAHNLYDQGLKDESHLMILNPGEKISGSVNYRLEKC